MENPFEKAFPRFSVSGDAHTYGTGGKEYDVYKLIRIANALPMITVAVATLEGQVLQEACWTDSEGKAFAPKNLLDAFTELGSWDAVTGVHPEWHEHIQKIEQADYRHPILLCRNELVDGTHRLIRAITEGVATLPAKNFDVLPNEALYAKP